MRHLKLQQPGRPRVRLRDLAGELGVRDIDLLAWLRENGEWTKSVMTFLEEPVVARARASFPAPHTATTTRTDSSADPEALTCTSPSGLGPPRRRARRDNNPFLGQLSSASEPPSPRRSPAQSVAAPLWRNQRATPDYSAAGSPPTSPTMAPFEWALRGVEATKTEWLEHGLGERDARLAAACRDAGLDPSDLVVDVSGWSVLERITHGEPPREVARLLARHRAQQREGRLSDSG